MSCRPARSPISKPCLVRSKTKQHGRPRTEVGGRPWMARWTPMVSLFPADPLTNPVLQPLERVPNSRRYPPDLVRDHVQAVLALVVPDHIAQIGHARHNLRRHAPRPPEQPAPAQG